ncbi:hypothetical protein PGTUg99_002646 [Puccinia graminis f. sp. tritici]|uniref:Uncharacterized protein n=1 Tax=Puccinia graminis f. sp. tritici TaxID=56615 RepID=A0A5B0QYV4_PUCGR|nr:hypothetical protein PGTUg99_002646 [Puccinia graminis f. sp. tritici]
MSEYIPGNRHLYIPHEYDFRHLPIFESDRPSRSSVEKKQEAMIFQPNFLPPAKRRRRGRSVVTFLGPIWMLAQGTTTGPLKKYASRGSLSSLEACRWPLVPKKASGPSFPFALIGFRSVLVCPQAGGGYSNRRGRGRMKVQAFSTLNIKPKEMRPSPPSTDPSPGTYHSYPMSTPPTTNTGVGVNVTEPRAPRFQPPPYNLNPPRFSHPVFHPHPPVFYPHGPVFPPHGRGGGARGRGFLRGPGGGRGRGWLPPASFRIRGQANRFYHPHGPATGVPFGHGHAPFFNSNRAQVDIDNFLNQHPIPPAVQRRPTPIPPVVQRQPTPISVPSSPSVPAARAARAPSNLSSIQSGDSFHTAEDFLAPQVRVESPTPAGMYDPDDYHLLARHQIESLLDRRAAPERFDRYEFTPQHFDNFYQSATSALVHHWTRHPAANANERQDRVRLFQFITRRYRTMTRRVV